MGRSVPLCLIAVLWAAGPAEAGKKRKVRIESEPPNASVYINAVEDGEQCKTPCSVDIEDAALLIVDLAGHKAVIETISFGRREKPPFKRSYTLVATLGKIIVKGPKGASVFVDDEDKGKAPLDVEVEAGPHAVELQLAGKTILARPVEVAANAEVEIPVPSTTVADATPDRDLPPGGDGDASIRGRIDPPPRRTDPILALSAITSVGFRDFQYQNVAAGAVNLDPASEAGQISPGAVLELWPGTLAGIRALRGLALVGRAQLGVNPQEVTDSDSGMPIGASTFWRNFEGSLRYRATLAGTATLEGSVGYLRDQHRFSGERSAIAQVPDADYQSLKLALRASLLLGSIEPYAAFENLVVMSGGPLAERFPMGADVAGVRGAAGIAASFGHIGVRLEGALTRYTWTFRQAEASGATDSIKYVSILAGYAY
jgi:hypothetical protein